MGTPAEARALLGHLLNVSYPYNYSNPKFELICDGVEELTEEYDADTEDVQYICETTKTTNVKGYTVGFDLEIKYVKGSAIQKYANRMLRVQPTGAKASGDYIRFNKDELMYGTNNQFIGVRRKATVYPESVGGSADDSLTSSLHISGNTEPEVGYVTLTKDQNNNPVFSWTPATTETPIITAPVEGEQITGSSVTIRGTGIVGATVTVYYGLGKSLEPVTVGTNGTWTATLQASELDTSATIAATQSIDGESSVTSETVSFTVISELSAPVITVPANSASDVSLTPTISGTGVVGATVSVSDGTSTILTATVDSEGAWTGIVSEALTAGTNYTITATQILGSVVSEESASVSFTTASE